MKIVHIGGGLGNQLADYFNYLIVKNTNPDDNVYVETIIYEIKEANDTVSQWNGYELKRVFDLDIPNIKELFSEDEWGHIIQEIRQKRFWENGWTPRTAIFEILNEHGCNLKIIGSLENEKISIYQRVRCFLTQRSMCYLSYLIKEFLISIRNIIKSDTESKAFGHLDGDYYYTPTFSTIKSQILLKKFGGEFIDSLRFPEITDENNKKICKIIQSTDSVGIHARRSDYLKYNEDCYKYGYFKKAVKYTKNHYKKPVYIIFSEDCEWCKENQVIFGLSQKDTVYFVDWNQKEDSYRDLQLLSLCKCNIITKSSFGYLACLMNKNPDKITCSQNSDYLTDMHFY